jgi:hypothetical protein
MNTESFGLVVTRAANRRGKSCEFKQDMIARLSRDYDLDAPFTLHTGIFIAARLSDNVTWTPAYWEWEKLCNRTK